MAREGIRMLRIKSRLILVVGVLALVLPGSARAARWVDLTVDLFGDPGRLTVSSVGVSLAGLGLVVDGASGFQPVPGLSLQSDYLDLPAPEFDAVLLSSAMLEDAFVAPGQEIVLGHFQSVAPTGGPVGPGGFLLLPGDDFWGATLFGPGLQALPLESFGAVVCDFDCLGQQVYRLVVPEPTGSACAAALALAAFIAAGRSGAGAGRSARRRSA